MKKIIFALLLMTSPAFAGQIYNPGTGGGGGGSVSITAGNSSVVVSPSPITGTGTVSFSTTPALGTPVSGVLTNTTGIGTTNMTAVTGSPSSTTYLRGDNTWANVAVGTNNQLQYNLAGTLAAVTPGSAGSQLLTGGTAMLPHWNKALAKVISGKGNGLVWCEGDSTAQGFYSTNTSSGDMQALSYCTQFSNALNGAGIYSTAEAFFGYGSTGARRDQSDAHLTVGSGWTFNTAQTAGGAWYYASGSTTSIAYLTKKPVDTFTIWYPQASGLGSFSYNIDGGGNTTVSNANATPILTKLVISAGSLGVHTINFNWVSGTAIAPIGLMATDSTKNEVVVMNAGWSGSGTAAWNVTTYPYSPAPACGGVAPDLAIINLMINDEQAALALNTFGTNLAALATQCQTGGATDVAFMTPNHTNPADNTTPVSEVTQATYAAQIRTTAAAASNSSGAVMGVPVIDEFANLVSYAFQNTYLGAVYTPGTYPNDLHMNWYGYGIMARDMMQALIPAGNSTGNYETNVSAVNITGTNISIGSGYVGNTPPVNGGLFQGTVGIGTAVTSASNALEVNGAVSVGYPDVAAPANGMVILGNVGIGTTTGLTAPLTISNAGNAKIVFADTNTAKTWNITGYQSNFIVNEQGVGTRAAFFAGGGVGIGTSTALRNSATLDVNGGLNISAATMINSSTTFTNGAGSSAGTLTNAPAVGNPTKWIPINDNGTTRYIPAW